MLWSVLRTERTGPTRSGACELKIAASRVIPPSTTSSYTTSAWSMPYCFAAPVLLIFTVTAGRVNDLPLLSTTPVSGARLPGFGGLGFVVGGGFEVAFFESSPLVSATTPTATSATTTTAPMITCTRRVRQRFRRVSFTLPARL